MSPSSQVPEIQILDAALAGWPLDPLMLVTLATLVGIYLAMAVILPKLAFRRREPIEWMRSLTAPAYFVAMKAQRVVVAIFLIAFLSGLANGLVRYPIPCVNDEFGYLLSADTFAHGRLANPPHDFWHYFETIGVSHQPAYIAKYPPGTSLFMALGQVLFGHPWWGQLLAYSLAAAAVAWMLRAWVGPRWGLVGAVIVALHPNLQHFQRYDYGWANYSWSHSYWGGAVAMLGAALVFGGLRHFLRRPRMGYGIALAVGAALLASSRPFEGFLACIPVAILLCVRVAQGRLAFALLLGRIVVPVAAVMLPFAFLVAANNAATTGDPLRLVHQHYADQYGAAAEFLIQEPRTPPASYGNTEMARFYLDWVRPTFDARQTSFPDYFESRARAFGKLFWFFFSTCWPALVVFPLLLRDRWWCFAGGVIGISIVLLLLTFDFHPHYAAPAVPLFFAVLAAGLAKLARLGGGESVLGRTVLVCVVGLTLGVRLWTLPPDQEFEDPTIGDWPRMRAYVVEQLQKIPGRDLVLVTTSADHLIFQNWVHNGADLDEGRVLFARDLDLPLESNPLLDYYVDRQLWQLELSLDTWVFRSIERPERLTGS